MNNLQEIIELKKEFEILGNAYTMQNVALKNLKSDYETQAGDLKRIKQDLEIRSNTEYRNKTTRQLAQEAFNQSTVTANWEGLGKHHVIEDIYKAINNRSTEEGRRADNVLRKLENQMSVEEFFDQLSKSDAIREINNAIITCDSNLAELNDVQNVDRHNIYEKINLQRDTIADIQTALHMLDFVMGETFDSHNSAFIFLMGVFAELGKGEIEKGLRFMLRDRKPKVEKDDGKKTSETPESS